MTDDTYLGLFFLVPSCLILIIYALEARRQGWPVGAWFHQGKAQLLGWAGLAGAVIFTFVRAEKPITGLLIVGGVSLVLIAPVALGNLREKSQPVSLACFAIGVLILTYVGVGPHIGTAERLTAANAPAFEPATTPQLTFQPTPKTYRYSFESGGSRYSFNSSEMLTDAQVAALAPEVVSQYEAEHTTDKIVMTPLAGSAQNITPNQEFFEWDKPAILKGTVHEDTFNNCCVDGKESRQVYHYLRPDMRVDIIDKSNTDPQPSMRGVQKVQLGSAGFDNMAEGERVTVSCKALWYGNTGHYALPAYCYEATSISTTD